MLIPAAMEDLHHPHAPLHEPPGEQETVGERPRLLHVVAIHLERGLALVGDVDEVRHARLHPEGHLVLRDPRLDLRVGIPLEAAGIQFAERVERAAAAGPRDAGRILQVEHGIARAAEGHARVARRQKPARPHPREDRLRRVDVGQRREDDERREIVVLAAEAVGEPAADACLARDLAACHDERVGRVVVDRVGVNGLHQRDLVDHLRRVGEKLCADPAAALPHLLELEFRGGHRQPRLAARHRGDPLLAANTCRDVLVEIVDELRLVVPEVDL